MLFFQSSWAFWGLLGIPILVAIHFFRRRARRIEISTLFLVKERERVTQRGAVWTRFENSLPFLLQLLALILLVICCSQPQLWRKDTQVRVAIVLDNSVSMRAFESETIEATLELIDTIQGGLTIDGGLFTSSQADANLGYFDSASSLKTLIQDQWDPRSGFHSIEPQLTAARRWAGDRGYVVYVSDRRIETSNTDFNLAVGKPRENVGITGIQFFEDGRWEARISNFSDSKQQREWWLGYEEGTTAPRQLLLEPGQSVRISGGDITALKRPFLQLSDDALEIDNSAPLLRPQTDPLKLHVNFDPENLKVWQQLAVGLEDWTVEVPQPAAHFQITDRISAAGNGTIRFLPSDSKRLSEDWSRGPYLREDHPLVEGLSMGGFLARFGTSDLPEDAVVFYRQGIQPVVWQSADAPRSLNIEWALAHSNMDRHPGMLLMLDRFLRESREQLGLIRSANYYFGEKIRVPLDAKVSTLRYWLPGDTKAREYTVESNKLAIAPRVVCSFELLNSEGRSIHQGTSHFWEASELDLRQSNASDVRELPWTERIESDMRPLPGLDLLPALILACLLASWYYTHRGEHSAGKEVHT